MPQQDCIDRCCITFAEVAGIIKAEPMRTMAASDYAETLERRDFTSVYSGGTGEFPTDELRALVHNWDAVKSGISAATIAEKLGQMAIAKGRPLALAA